MCWATKCCFLIPLDLACVFIGVGNFIFSVITTVVSTALLIIQKQYDHEHFDGHHILQQIYQFEMKRAIIDIMVIVALIISVLWTFFSTFLIAGVRKNIPSLVLSYFVYGVIVTIICFLASLFEFISQFWMIAMIQAILCLINIHFLVVVHTVYELMCRGKVFGDNNHNLLDEESFLENQPES